MTLSLFAFFFHNVQEIKTFEKKNYLSLDEDSSMTTNSLIDERILNLYCL